jgi:hypothetical protein
MDPRPRLATFTLQLPLICSLFCVPCQASNERGTGQTSADRSPANHLLGHQETTQQPTEAPDAQSPAKDPDPLFPVLEHGKWGYMDKTGKIVIKPEYYDAFPFKEGMARIQPFAVLLSKAIRVQFIDKSGKILDMSTIYSYAEDFSEGLALVAIPGERGLGYVDTTGKIVIPQDDSWQMAQSFHEGLAAIKQGGQWGYVDKLGKTVIAPQFSEAYRFSEGLAAVKNGGKWGYIDETGKTVVALQYETAYQHVEGLAAVKEGGKWGFIDKTGKMVIQPKFDDAYGFSEGLVEVKSGGKWGFSDKNGELVIAPRYDAVHAHFDGLAGVKEGGKWGYIDKAGKMVIPAQFDAVAGFWEGLALVRVGKKFGYIDKTGKYVWAPAK